MAGKKGRITVRQDRKKVFPLKGKRVGGGKRKPQRLPAGTKFGVDKKSMGKLKREKRVGGNNIAVLWDQKGTPATRL